MCTSHANFELNTHVINYTISVSIVIVAQVQPHTAANMAVDWEWQ